jgi:transposase-like protein
MPWRSAGSKSAMRPSDFGGTGLARCSRHRSERSGLRIYAASPGGWHLDEVFVKINGTLCYLWRAVDHEGEVFGDRGHGEADKVAALKFLKRIMKKYGQPKSVVTDGLCSYPAAMKEIGNADRPEGWPSAQQPRGKLASALSTTKRAMRLFRNQKTLQKFSSIRAQVHNHSTRNVISSPAKSTNKDARLRWPNGAQSWPDPHVEFLSRQTHTVVHRSRFCLTRP